MVLFSFFDNFGMNKYNKVVFVGDAAVGKTQIISRYVKNFFDDDYTHTIGTEYAVKEVEINNKKIKLQLWETTEYEKYKSIIGNIYQKAEIIVLVYAINNRESFDNISDWVKKVKTYNKNVKFLLVGNKCDLVEKRQVTKEDAENYAKANKMEFIEISAKAGTNIEKMFNSSLLKILEDENNIENEKKQIDNYSHIDINHNNNLPFCNKYCSCCLCLKKSEGNVEEEEEIEYGE